MSVTDAPSGFPDFLIGTRGRTRNLGAYVVAACFSADGTLCAFALGDGTVRLATVRGPDAEWRTVAAHDGAAMALAPDPAGGFISGGDDGRLVRIGRDGEAHEIARFGSKWVEHVATHSDGNGRGVIACAVGRAVHVFDAAGAKLKELAHPSTVSGLALDAKGKRIAAAHYNGVSIWFVAAKKDTPRLLDWKGSHTGLVINPDGDIVVTSMQENALHGWRLSDGQHMRMGGYPAKTRSMSFSRTGKWLATSGADSIVIWPFFGGGPMGKAPTELAGGDNTLCHAVAFNPREDHCAGGFADGLVVLVDPARSRVVPVAPPGTGSVATLGWSPDGGYLAVGGEQGFAALVDFTARS